MDDVGVFTVGLSEDEINDIMNNGLKYYVTAVENTGKLSTRWGMIKDKSQ